MRRLIAGALALIAALGLPAPPIAAQQHRYLPIVAYGGGSPAGTPTGPAWVCGNSSFRTAASTTGLFTPDASRLVQIGDRVLPAQPAGYRVVFTNFGLNSNILPVGSPRESLPGNANRIEYAVAFTGAGGTGTRVQLTFGGQNGVTMPDGGFAVSDPVPTAFAGGFLRYASITPAGGKRMGVFTAMTQLGEVTRDYPAGDARLATLMAGGAISGGNTGNTAAQYGPAAVLVPWSRQPSILLLGDSITQQDDNAATFADARGVVGGIARGLDNAGPTGRFGVCNLGHHGAKMIDFLDVAPGSLKFSQRYALLRYIRDTLNGGQVWPFSAIWSQGLRNDFTDLSGFTDEVGALAAMKARAGDWWGFLDRNFAGVPLIQSTISPRTIDNTSQRTSVAAQTPNTALTSGAPLQAFNDWTMTTPAPLALAVDLRGPAQELNNGVPVWTPGPFSKSGGGTLTTALATGATTSFTVAATVPPEIGALPVFEPETASMERVGAVTGVANNGNGTFTVTITSGTLTKAHPAGSVVKLSNSNDGTHPASSIHQAWAVVVIAAKAAIAFVRPR